MEKFTYKMGIVTWSVDVSKEMITFKNKTIPAALITGIGVGIQGNKNTLVARGVGAGVGGIVGGLLAGGIAGAMEKKTTNEESEMAKNLNLPANSLGRMIVAYQENPTAKKQTILIPINTSIPECQTMIAKVKDYFPGKFVGVDKSPVIYKALGVKDKELILGLIILGVIFGIAGLILLLNATGTMSV